MLFQMCIRKFIIQARIYNETELIIDEGYKVNEAASEVGYTNIGHYSSLFKEEFRVLQYKL